MVEIISHLHQYVPAVEYTRQVIVPNGLGDTAEIQQASLHAVLVGGDQLTAARARGAKKARVNSVSPVTRLDRLIPCAEDWHTKLNFLGVCCMNWTIAIESLITNPC